MNRIEKYRRAACLTQEKLAELSGVSRSAISRLEILGNHPQKYTAERLAKVLKIPVDVLTGDDREKYNWQYAQSYLPEEEGQYLCAYRKKYTKGIRFTVLTWRNQKWVEESMNGYAIEYTPPGRVLWWAEIENPPE